MVLRADFPNDDDGEVLYRLALDGVDLTKKRKIEFSFLVDTLERGNEIADDLKTNGYSPSIFVDDGPQGTGDISIYAGLVMKPNYQLLIIEQRRLDLILEPYGTKCDGWMTESS